MTGKQKQYGIEKLEETKKKKDFKKHGQDKIMETFEKAEITSLEAKELVRDWKEWKNIINNIKFIQKLNLHTPQGKVLVKEYPNKIYSRLNKTLKLKMFISPYIQSYYIAIVVIFMANFITINRYCTIK